MTNITQELFLKAETVKNILMAKATGGSNDDSYPTVRAELVKHPLVKDKLPRFVASCRTLDEFWCFIQPKYKHYAERRTYILEAFEPLLTFLEQSASVPSDEAHNQALNNVDSANVQLAWQKALDRRSSDPDGAITAARTLLEAVCKHILDSLSVPYDEKAELPKLYGVVAQSLNLSPSQHTVQVFKQILGGCQAVVEGLGAMRNRLGDAHGPGKAGVRPLPRHAELAVNLAGTMATFLIATWEASKQ